MLAHHVIAAGAPDLAAALAAASLPIEDLTDAGRTFYRFDTDGAPVGYAGYELYGPDALLRSVVVLPEMRGRGFGRAIAEEALGRAYLEGARTAYLLTTTAEEFFEHLGFRPIARTKAPASILATRQATTICATAALLARPLRPRD